ncbi:M55 family metallopeptidase [Fervidicoccus fontis]|uniref:Exopeptidase, family M55 n=1 Tax=Fervidicoccus fontis (strain DSM 19380 / JCM 18336 / VKM B-2539 / Kam940) TaxID=1163730 RepID=I0A1N6_FERFK|nr:M55 family metallopeptidase [Fervidicoccus fontis]AFH42893.1 exopeptidase, family M55 [Fervidicoccus fontis Kam940]
MKKAFLSVDLEGLPFIVNRGQLSTGNPLWEEGRRIASELTYAAVKAIHDEGFDEVIVADSHADMINIYYERLPKYAYLVRGYPRPRSMITGAEGCSAAFFLGYHAGVGTKDATYDHSFSSATIKELRLNSEKTSEFIFNTLALGEIGIPVIFVAGDEALREDVEKFAPWAVFVPLKKSYGRYSSISPSIEKLNEDLAQGVKEAVRRMSNGEANVASIDKPVNVKIDFLYSGYAEVAEYLPFVKRVSATAIEYISNSVLEAYNIMELLTIVASAVKVMTGQ